jgi:K+-transporting ATPase KdpF subunit
LGWAAVVSAENVVGLVVALLLTVFLVAALLFPERF